MSSGSSRVGGKPVNGSTPPAHLGAHHANDPKQVGIMGAPSSTSAGVSNATVGSYTLNVNHGSGPRRLSSTPHNPTIGGAPSHTSGSTSPSNAKKTTTTPGGNQHSSSIPQTGTQLAQPGAYNPRRLSTLGANSSNNGSGGAYGSNTSSAHPYHSLLSSGVSGSASPTSGRGGTVAAKSPSRLRQTIISGGKSSSIDSGMVGAHSSSNSSSGNHHDEGDNQLAGGRGPVVPQSLSGSARRQSSTSSRNGSAGSPFPVGSAANAVNVLGSSRGPSPTTTQPANSVVRSWSGVAGAGDLERQDSHPGSALPGLQLFPGNVGERGSSHSLNSATSSSGTQPPTSLPRNTSSGNGSTHTLSDLKRDSVRNSSSHSINGTSSTSLHSDGTSTFVQGTPALGPMLPSPSHHAPHLETPNKSVQVLRRISQSRAQEEEGPASSRNRGGDHRRGSAASNASSSDPPGLNSRSDSEYSLRSVPSGLALPTINIAVSDQAPNFNFAQPQGANPPPMVSVPPSQRTTSSSNINTARSTLSSSGNLGASLGVQEPGMLFRKNSKYESPFGVDSPDTLGSSTAGGDPLMSSATSPSSSSGVNSQQAFMSSSGGAGLLSVDQAWAWDAPSARGGSSPPGRRVSLNFAAAAPAPNTTQARQRRLSSIYCEFAMKVEDFLRQPNVSSTSSNSGAETPRESPQDHVSHSSSPNASPSVGAISNPSQPTSDHSKKLKPTLSGFDSVPNTSFGSASAVGFVGRSVSGGLNAFNAGSSLSNLSVPMFQHSRRRSSRANAEPEEQHLSGSGNLLTLFDMNGPQHHQQPPRSPSKLNISASQAESRRTSPSRSSNGGRKRSSGVRSLALRSLWQLIDVENAGEVSCERLLEAFERVGFQRVHSREKIKTMFAIADVNRTGKLKWPEFSRFFKHLASVDLLEAEDREEALAKRRSSSYTSPTMARSINASTNQVLEPSALKRATSSTSSSSHHAAQGEGGAKPDYFACSLTSSPSSPSEASFAGSKGPHPSGNDHPFTVSGEFSLERGSSGGALGGAAGSGDVTGDSIIPIEDTIATTTAEDEDDDEDLIDIEDDDDELSEENIRKRQQALMQSYSNPIPVDEQRSLEAAGPEIALMSASATTAAPMNASDAASSTAAGRRHTMEGSIMEGIDAPMFSITIDGADENATQRRVSAVATEQRVDPSALGSTSALGLLATDNGQQMVSSLSRRPSVSFNPNNRRRISSSPAHRMKSTVFLRRYSVEVLSGLRQRIKCIALAPRRNLIAACHRQENSVHIYDLNGNELRVLSGHKDSMLGVAFSVDRKAIATASRDKTVTVWDCTVGHELGVVEHPGIVTAIAFSADGKTFFTGCQDNLVRRFHTHKCRYLRCMETLPNSHQGVIVALAAQHHANELILCSRSCDKCALVLDAQTLEVVAALEGHSSMVWQAQFNADGSRIVTLCETSVIVWEASMLQPLQTFPSTLLGKYGFPKPMPLPNPKTGKKPKVKAKLWTTALFCPAPLGTLLACFGTDASVLFFDYISGELVLQLQLRSTAYCAAATDDGDRIVCGDDWGNLYQIMLSA